MDFKDYTAEDFLLDDSFLAYCLQKDAADAAFWSHWITQHPEKEREVRIAKRIFFELGIRLSPEEKAAEFEKLKTAIAKLRMEEDEKDAAITTIAQPVKGLTIWRWTAAAAACFAIFFGVKYFMATSEKQNGPVAYTLYQTGAGMRKTLELADGSTVILNSNSTIKIPNDFNGVERNVLVQGEALLKVKHDEKKPFSVHAGDVNIKDIGTEFRVSNYSFNQSTAVTLLEGEVNVTNEATGSINMNLHQGQLLTIDNEGKALPLETINLGDEEDWKQNRLAFEDASPQQIAQKLQHWYGMKVKLNISSNKPVHFNGVFTDKDLPTVLHAISFVTGLECDVAGNEIMISSK